MADFLRESADGKRTKKSEQKKIIEPARPSTPKTSRRGRERALLDLIKDFRLGLTSLRSLASRLQTTQSDYTAQRANLSSPHKHTTAAAQSPAPKHDNITKIIERERQLIERQLVMLPAKERELLMKTYTTHMQTATSAQAPQAYAALIRGADTINPAKVLRPNQPYVKELMATARAIKSGRAAFVPSKVKAKARELLSILFGKQQATQMLTSTDPVTQRLISQYRLVPQSIRAALSATPRKSMTRLDRELQTTIHKVLHSSPSRPVPGAPISRSELAHVAPALPALHTGGVAMGAAGGAASGEYRMEAGENVHVVTRDDAVVSAPEPPPPYEPKPASIDKPEQPKGKISAPGRQAPKPATSVTPSSSDVVNSKVTPYAGPQRPTDSSGDTATRAGGIKVSEVEGLDQWISQTERRLDELHG